VKRKHKSLLAAFLGTVLLVIGGVYFSTRGRPYQPPSFGFHGESKDLRQSVVVPTLDTPMPKGRNVVWCGTTQLGWKHLEKDVLHAPPVIPGAEPVISRLNRALLKENDLPAGSFIATAGYIKDGIAEKVKTEMAQRFQKTVELGSMLEPDGILVYSYLQTACAFSIPFFDNREPFRFRDSTGEETEVTAFGIEEKHEYAYQRLRDQIDVLYALRNRRKMEVEEFALDLCKDSSPNQFVVASVPPKEDLLATLRDVEEKIDKYPKRVVSETGNPEAVNFCKEFGIRDVLLVPNMNWEIQHRFAELEGSDKKFANPGFTGYHIERAEQMIRFKLDRSGAELASESKIYCKPMATHYVLDRPFLIYIKKRGQKHPFFVMWVDNAELLSKP
jgi:hypothetical protein